MAFLPKLFQEQLGGTKVHAFAVDVNGIGRLVEQQQPYVTAPVNYVVLSDIATSQKWQVFVIPGPFFDVTVTALPPSGRLRVTAPGNNNTYELQIKNGILQTANIATGQADPVVGQLYDFDTANLQGGPDPREQGWLPKYTQPGGIGTPTFPQQSQGSQSMVDGVPQELGMGLFIAGCGHTFVHWDLQSGTYQNGTACFVRCPLCSYVQRIIFPYSLIHTVPFEFIQG